MRGEDERQEARAFGIAVVIILVLFLIAYCGGKHA